MRGYYINLPYFAVHTPIQGRKDLVEKYKGRKDVSPQYAALVTGMDENIGRLLAHVKKLGLEENTLVIFSSDNGGIRSISKQDPYRAGKGSYYEGGIREPMIVKWPGKVAAGSRCETMVTGLNFTLLF